MLFDGALTEGWDGSGFVYTVDWDGRPVVRDHLTGCCARRSPRPRCWASARSSANGGSWPSASSSTATAAAGGWPATRENRPSSDVWDGKPDVYHALGAIDASLHADQR